MQFAIWYGNRGKLLNLPSTLTVAIIAFGHRLRKPSINPVG
jgi:hypothetical protein